MASTTTDITNINIPGELDPSSSQASGIRQNWKQEADKIISSLDASDDTLSRLAMEMDNPVLSTEANRQWFQMQLQSRMQMSTMLSNVSRTLFEMAMNIIRNLRLS